MIGALLLLVISMSVTTQGQSTPVSPCPNVFMYEPGNTERDRWYGVLHISTDTTLHSLWLNIVLDRKADLLGNWLGDVTTTDNKDFKIENTKVKIHPGPPTSVRFFVKYDIHKQMPSVREIMLNGRELCNKKGPKSMINTLDSAEVVTSPKVLQPDEMQPPHEPSNFRPVYSPTEETVMGPKYNRKSVQERPYSVGPVYIPTSNPSHDNVNPFNVDGSRDQSEGATERRPTTFQLTPRPHPTTPKDSDDDDYSDSKVDPSEYWSPGKHIISSSYGTTSPASIIKTSQANDQNKDQCGKVTKNNATPLVVRGKPTLEGQWPWQIALYRTLAVNSEYICGGTLVSHKHVITAAHCVTRKNSPKPVNKNSLMIHLGKHNLRLSDEGVELRLVSEITVHREYYKTPFARDLSILTMRDPVEYTDFVKAACLWPEDQIALSNVVGKIGSVVGWGIDETGVATEELTLVEMPVVDQETCVRSHSSFYAQFTDDYTYCAGFRDGSSVCEGDSGDGMVFEMNGIWYLRGLVSLSRSTPKYVCDPTNYVIFTDLAKFLPWIKDQIGL